MEEKEARAVRGSFSQGITWEPNSPTNRPIAPQLGVARCPSIPTSSFDPNCRRYIPSLAVVCEEKVVSMRTPSAIWTFLLSRWKIIPRSIRKKIACQLSVLDTRPSTFCTYRAGAKKLHSAPAKLGACQQIPFPVLPTRGKYHRTPPHDPNTETKKRERKWGRAHYGGWVISPRRNTSSAPPRSCVLICSELFPSSQHPTKKKTIRRRRPSAHFPQGGKTPKRTTEAARPKSLGKSSPPPSCSSHTHMAPETVSRQSSFFVVLRTDKKKNGKLRKTYNGGVRRSGFPCRSFRALPPPFRYPLKQFPLPQKKTKRHMEASVGGDRGRDRGGKGQQ